MKFTRLCLSALLLTLNTPAEEIKVKDLKNSEVRSTPKVDGGPSLSPEQLKKLQEDVEKIRENRRKSQEALDELE